MDALFASLGPSSARVQRDPGGVALLPYRTFGATERPGNRSGRRLLPRHLSQCINVSLEPSLAPDSLLRCFLHLYLPISGSRFTHCSISLSINVQASRILGRLHLTNLQRRPFSFADVNENNRRLAELPAHRMYTKSMRGCFSKNAAVEFASAPFEPPARARRPPRAALRCE